MKESDSFIEQIEKNKKMFIENKQYGESAISKEGNLKLQINDIEKREIPQANHDIEGNKNKIKTYNDSKIMYLDKKQTSENKQTIQNFEKQIQELETTNREIQAKIIERQTKLSQLKAELQKITEYETECHKITAACQQQIEALDNQYK
ncbi:MAG: hypothetical protein ACLTFB_01710 [Candidatus Phytoplasma pyri]